MNIANKIVFNRCQDTENLWNCPSVFVFSGYLAHLEKRALRFFFNLPHLAGKLVSTRPKGEIHFFLFAEFCLSAKVILKMGKLGKGGGSPGRGF